MALPSIDHSSSHPGVYLSCFAQISDQRLQGPADHLISTTNQDYGVSSGLYAGSSVKSVSGRCIDHAKGTRPEVVQKFVWFWPKSKFPKSSRTKQAASEERGIVVAR
ncbi:hypothetical protein N7534_006723 [Penicillium rubens]|nr:hypothetical protein N7534_006723 [Penicillium rubens]